jgi:hypothetical protein
VFAPILLASLLAGPPAPPPAVPVDLGAIPRTIAREPAYQGKPRYCLLVFGQDAATRIWMVQDGGTLYIDRTGNGDLTAAGNKFASQNPNYFVVDRVFERDGTIHQNLQVSSRDDGTFFLVLGGQEEREQYVGYGRMERPSWGDRLETAPIIHFNGPKALARYNQVLTLPRGDVQNRRAKLQLMLGTPGLGKGTFASYNEACSDNLGPVHAVIAYAPNERGMSLRQEIDLEHDG